MFRYFFAVLTMGFLLVSCSYSEEASTCEPSSNHKIVSLSPTATEMVYAIGAEVVAADEFSTYPPAVPNISGLSGFTPSVESILSYKPNVVLVSSLREDDDFAKLAEFKVCVLRLGAASELEEVYEQIDTLGKLTKRQTQSDKLIEDLRMAIAQIVGEGTYPKRTYFYELDSTFYSITDNTFIGNVLGLLNLSSIAPADGGNNYPQLNEEFILTSNPGIIMLADGKCCGQDVATVKARVGWSNLSAVKENKVLEIDEDIASRWGPRILELLKEVSDFLEEKFN